MSTKQITGRTVLFITLAFFGVVISVNTVMITLAVKTLPGTEVDSAYKAGLAYNREIAAAQAQEQRHWIVKAEVSRTADGAAIVVIDARDRQGAPVTYADFSARLERPADKREDRDVALVRRAPGAYRGEATGIAPGQWDLVIEAERDGERLFLSSNRVILSQN